MKIKYDKIMGKIRESDELIPGTGLAVDPETGEVSVVGGGESANAVVMTTSERIALVLGEGVLVWDTDLEKLFVGDGSTAGGKEIEGGGGSLDGEIASIDEVMTGITGGTTAVVDVSALRGALTAGQAVDVTSQPDGVTGDYKGTFSVTGSLGFASFPKYASGLNYLMIADLTATTSGTVTPSGTWLDGTTTAKNLAAGTSTRVAMLFDAANKAKFTFASTGSVSVSHCREYEVTACSNEAIAYIAALSNPDAFASYYLIKADMVQPWTYIIDMGTSPAVTIASGLSYKLNATGTHQLTVDTCPAGYDGRDAIIRIRLGGSGVIQAVAPLQLGGALVPYAINNCVVRFRDGEAVLLVEDTLAGYVVTVNTGTGEGSLPYGIAANGVPYIAFSPSTDGIPVDLSGATTAAEEVTVVGNGYEETILTGSITCTSKTIVANLALSNTVVNGGTMTLGDVYIPSGSTVAVSGGGLAVEKVTGNGGVIDLGGKNINVESGGSAYASGVLISGGSPSTAGGAFNLGTIATLELNNVELCYNSTGNFAGAIAGTNNNTIRLISCYIHHNQNRTGVLYIAGGSATMLISGSTIGADQRCYLAAGKATFVGSNLFTSIMNGGGACTVSSGAIIDLTGNANASPIAPTGGVYVSGGCTVINSAGSTVSITGGTYTKINKDGTTA